MSDLAIALLVLLAIVVAGALLTLGREVPSIRRYLRIKRM
jgi:hypothetical protein